MNLAYDEIGGELHSDRHHNLLERPQVLSVTHSFGGPWNINRTVSQFRTLDQ